MGRVARSMLVFTIGSAIGTVSASGSVSAVASLELEIVATSTPTHWLEERTFEALLTNDGDEPVSGVTGLVSSAELPRISVALDSPTPVIGNGDDVLEPGEQWRYDVTVPTISQWGFFVEGTVPSGSVDVFERSSEDRYPSAFTFPASIEIENDTGPVPEGTEVAFAVAITSEVAVPLTLDCEQALDDAALTVDLEPIGAPTASGNGDDVLDPDETWTWSVTHPVTASGVALHVWCELDLASGPTGGLRFGEIGALIALPPPPASIGLEATPGSTPTLWLEDRTYDLVVTNTGDQTLSSVTITVESIDATPAGGAALTGPTEIEGDGDDEFEPGEQIQYTAFVPNLASWTFAASALTLGGDDVVALAGGERNVPDGTYADPVLVEIAPVEGSLLVVGEPATVSLTNVAEFDLVVTVQSPWGRNGDTTVESLAAGASTSWTMPAPFRARVDYAYLRDVVGFALGGSVDLQLAIVDPPPPTTTTPTTTLAPVVTLPPTGSGAGALVAVALATVLAGLTMLTAARRPRSQT